MTTDYNHGKNLNHYNHLKAGSLQEYLQILKNYQLKSLEFQGKLNLPSFGQINDTKEKSIFLPLLMQSYVTNSPVPVIHYQRSYMKFLDEILREYFGGKPDQSGRVKRRMQRKKFRDLNNTFQRMSAAEDGHTSLIDQQAETNNFFHVKLTGFLSDMLFLVTDFDETVTQFTNDAPDQLATQEVLEPDQIEDDGKRDDYLRRYNGIVISTENLCVKTVLEVHHGDETYFKAEESYFKNKFLRLSALNS